jgi:hypothetical protein
MLHPKPKELISFCEKMARELDDPRAYLKRTAEWVKDRYAESAPALLPELRRIYKTTKPKR